MTYGYGPERHPSEGADNDPDSSRRRRPSSGGPSSAASGSGTPPPRVPQPPPPARHLPRPAAPSGPAPTPPSSVPYSPTPYSSGAYGGGPSAPPRRAPNGPSQPPAYPAYPPPVPTSPSVPRMPPRPGTPGNPHPPTGPLRTPGANPSTGATRSPGGAGRTPPGAPPRPAAPGRPTPAPGRPGRSTPGRRAPLPPSDHPRSVKLSEAVPGLIRHLPHHKPWMVALSVIASLVILAVCGMGSYLLVKDDSKTVGADPTPTNTTPMRDIDSRTSDATPMTAADVFPGTTIVADPTIPPYKRVGAVQVQSNCRVAATADVGKLLVSLGCNQVIRATFTAPDPGYVVTAGVFNLKDSASATRAHDQLNKLINSKNRLTGYVTASSTRTLFTAPTNLAFYAQGHFLIYLVVARTDGKESQPSDQHITVIVYDLLEKYLRDTVLTKWAIDHSAPSGAPTPSGS